MELLFGALVSIGVEIVKKVQSKLGKNGVIILVFLACLVVAAIYEKVWKELSPEQLETLAIIFATSIGFYEVVIKRLFSPALKALAKK